MYKPQIPSSLLSQSDELTIDKHEYANFGLKSGVILKTYEIDDENNRSKLAPEYDVVCYEQGGSGAATSTTYKNCTFMDSMGGIGDFFEFKRRQPTNDEYKSDQDIEKYDGALVALLCFDGISDKGMILGAIINPNRKTTLTKESGHHMEAEFNGLNFQVNKDGELTVTFKSKTDNKGVAQDKVAGGSFYKFDKEGSFKLSDNENGLFYLNKKEKTLTVQTEKDQSVTSLKGGFALKTEKNISLTTNADLIAKATGSALMDFAKEFSLTTAGKGSAKAASWELTADDLFKVSATTVQVGASKIFLGNGGTPALLQFTQMIGTGNLGGPVLSLPIGPFSSTVFIAP